jgi:hypothetical protein
MKALVTFAALLVLALGVAHAADPMDIDESKLSPEGRALKAKYEAAMQKMQADFMAELGKLTGRVEQVEKKTAPPAKKPWYDSIAINGYAQARYWARKYDSTAAEMDDFGIRRYYMNVIGTHPKGQFVATYCGTGPDFRENAVARWENMFAEYWPNSKISVRAGLCPTFFGLDDSESSAIRLTPERAMGLEGSPTLGLTGLYPSGPSDYGVWLIYDDRATPRGGRPMPKNPGWRVDVSVHNGQLDKTDKNTNKNIAADAEYFFDWGQVGASYLDGMFTRTPAGTPAPPAVTETRKAFGLNARVFPGQVIKNVGLQAEWFDGKWYGTDRRGWYGQASYHFPDHPTVLFTRYERFDPNQAATNDDYRGLHLGFKYLLTTQDEITLEFTDGKLGQFTTQDSIVQYQRAF